MARYLRMARPYLVLLVIFTVMRWVQSVVLHLPYEKVHHTFSMITLTFFASAFYGMFCRRWQGYAVKDALLQGMTMGVCAQVLIFLSTLVSYLAGMETFFNYPTALNVEKALPMAEAMGRRAGGLVIGPIITGIVGMIGWALGGLLPERQG